MSMQNNIDSVTKTGKTSKDESIDNISCDLRKNPTNILIGIKQDGNQQIVPISALKLISVALERTVSALSLKNFQINPKMVNDVLPDFKKCIEKMVNVETTSKVQVNTGENNTKKV